MSRSHCSKISQHFHFCTNNLIGTFLHIGIFHLWPMYHHLFTSCITTMNSNSALQTKNSPLSIHAHKMSPRRQTLDNQQLRWNGLYLQLLITAGQSLVLVVIQHQDPSLPLDRQMWHARLWTAVEIRQHAISLCTLTVYKALNFITFCILRPFWTWLELYLKQDFKYNSYDRSEKCSKGI